MASVVDSIAQFISTDLSIGTYPGTIFLDSMPDASDGSLDTCIAVYNLPGQAPDLAVGAGQTTTDYPGFMVACRSLSAATALSNDLAIYQGLHGQASVTIHGTYFVLIAAAQSAPMALGRDEKQRLAYSRSFRAIVQGVAR